MRWLENLAAVIVVAALPGCAEEGKRAQPEIASRDYVSWPAVSPRAEVKHDSVDASELAVLVDRYGWPINPMPDPAADEVRSWYPEPSGLLSTDSWNPGFAPGPKLIESLAVILRAGGQPPRVVPLTINWGRPLRRYRRYGCDPGMEDDGEYK